jgi:hypothetical protein
MISMVEGSTHSTLPFSRSGQCRTNHNEDPMEDIWKKTRVTCVKVYLTHNICEGPESGLNVENLLWVHITLGDINMPCHSNLWHSGNILVHHHVKPPRVGLCRSTLSYPFTMLNLMIEKGPKGSLDPRSMLIHNSNIQGFWCYDIVVLSKWSMSD